MTGDISVGFVIAGLLKKGLSVSLPFGDRDRYDLIVDVPSGLKKIQVKTGRIRNGVILFNPFSVDRDTGKRFYYKNEIDCFAIFSPENGKVYMVSVDEVETSGSLRLEKPKNNQRKNIKWAKNYELEEWKQYKP